MKKLIVATALVGVLSLTGSTPLIFAHHGGAIEWFDGKPLGPITVTATRFAFSFPHPQFYGDVKDEKGNTQAWSFVMRVTPTGLRELGWSSKSIKPGDTLTVTYNAHKTMKTVAQPVRVLINGKFLPLEPGEKE